MKFAHGLALALALLLLGTIPAAGAVLTPGLEDQLDRMTDQEVVRVLVVLHEQVDLPGLDRELRAQKAVTADRHRRVLGALQATAAGSQADLLATLGADKAAGGILGFHAHWLVNSVVVTGTVEAIRALATHPDVARIEPDLVVELIEPLASPKGVAKDAAGIGTTPGVAAIDARRVWEELGIDGSGVVVGILDTGVDGDHPALAGRWRGTVAPAAECWLDAAGFGDTDFPVDRHHHGTHVMGTLTGLAADDTIGVAPGALWIASNVINHPGSSEEFDNAIIASLEFMADPDGNPATSLDVPAVVHNSWGVSESFDGYFDCDSRWWTALDAVETAGVVLTWSAGNEGPNAGSLRSPADRATSPLNAFSIGSTATFAPFAVSDFSSRGPSGCGGAYAMKPEVVAPGENIYSAQPGGGYQYLSGTSMAGPHVAGVVALMRASNPDATVDEIKQILMDTAHDLGSPGEDNDSGHGLINAYDAVTAIMGNVGTVTGTVTDADTGQPVAGALVRLDATDHTNLTDATGAYRMVVPSGAAVFTVSAFGYLDGTVAVTVPDGGAVIADGALALRPVASVSGVVRGPDQETVAGATVTAEGTPVPAAVTDGDGYYSLELPAGPDLVYTLRARATGYGSATGSVVLSGPVSADFELPPQTAEDFESGDFTTFAWTHGGDAPWNIDDVTVYEGVFSARSGSPGPNGTSRLVLDYDVLDTGDVTFRYRVSSEAGYDNLFFFVDGSLRAQWSGELPWTAHTETLPAGPHTLMWSYEKDDSVADGADAAWIDLVELPAQATPLVPAAVVEPVSLGLTLGPNDTGSLPLDLGNLGDADLEFTIAPGTLPTVTAVTNPVSYRRLVKSAVDPRPAVARTTGQGGPDVFGYSWRDSDDPRGPSFDWIDISVDGLPAGGGDDASLGPFFLEFPFTYYGNTFTAVRVATNGFVSFTSSSAAWANQGIPDPAEPNNLLAAFWDDLNVDLGGEIFVRSEPDRFIVQFQDVAHYGDAGTTETFQVILTADGVIVFQYAEVGDDAGCTVGIENGAGSDGLLLAFNAAGSLHDGLAVRFAADLPPAWLASDTAAGTVPVAGSTTVNVLFDAAGLAAGDHEAFLNIVTNDPHRPVIAVPVTLTVNELADAPGGPPRRLTLGGAVPNPFNPATTVRFGVPRAGPVRLALYDVAGRLVRRLLDESLAAGAHEVRWNGRDDGGRAVASGTYFARLTAGGEVVTRAMTLVR